MTSSKCPFIQHKSMRNDKLDNMEEESDVDETHEEKKDDDYHEKGTDDEIRNQ